MLENQYQYDLPEAGCDEAGRGCLAGPVFAAAVMLPPDFHDPLLNDSKQMTERNREKLRAVIEREAVAWAVEAVSAARIDEINILSATKRAMEECAAGFTGGMILVDAVDGLKLPVPHRSIIRGDALCYMIAAASVVAKVERDRYMIQLAEEYPQYGFERNKGYGTAEHIRAIREYGPCPAHRMSFIKHFL